MMQAEARDAAQELISDAAVPVESQSDLCLALGTAVPLLDRLRTVRGVPGPVRAALGILVPFLRTMRGHLGCGS